MRDATQRAVRPYRQGDVLLVPCTDIPTRAFEEAAEIGRVVLARGERTGHAHTMPADRVRYFREDGTGNGFIRVAGPPPAHLPRSEERGVGKECVGTGKSRWWRDNNKKQKREKIR